MARYGRDGRDTYNLLHITVYNLRYSIGGDGVLLLFKKYVNVSIPLQIIIS